MLSYSTMERIAQPAMRETGALLPAPPRGADMARQLERDGYLVLACPDLLGEHIAGLWRAADAFFGLPDARKRANSLAEHDGYHAIGEEYSDRPDRPDLAESFWARLIHANATARLPDPEGRAMHRAALAVSAELETLLTELTEALARHYAERWSPEQAFRCDQASHLQFNRYQPSRHDRELLTEFARGRALPHRPVRRRARPRGADPQG